MRKIHISSFIKTMLDNDKINKFYDEIILQIEELLEKYSENENEKISIFVDENNLTINKIPNSIQFIIDIGYIFNSDIVKYCRELLFTNSDEKYNIIDNNYKILHKDEYEFI